MIGSRLGSTFLVNKFSARMSSSKFTYEDAIQKLNSLQSNKSTIVQVRRDIKNGKKCSNMADMENYLSRTGLNLERLDELSVIHVAGTKGKGSTSAMCESILRHYGYKTGFYSSPHLVAVRERIRLDGAVISKEKFSKYFHQVYDMLHGSQAYEGDMPKYFAYLTVLAFHVFLKEKVDIAIVEVGIGGIVDYTNVLSLHQVYWYTGEPTYRTTLLTMEPRQFIKSLLSGLIFVHVKVPIVGITALGLDHTSILGNTVAQIAEAKAGIMKPGCEAYTVAQAPEAMAVLQTVARNVKCPLTVAPSYNSYTFPKDLTSHLPLSIEAYQTNASLAIQLAHGWLRHASQQINKTNIFKTQNENRIIQSTEISSIITDNSKENLTDEALVKTLQRETMLGLLECKWPGRYHEIQTDYAKFYLDGAHTKESMEICSQWFKDNNRCQDTILIFSATGDRDSEILLKPLKSVNFKSVYFVIPTAFKGTSQKNDNYSLVEQKELLTRCENHLRIWKKTNGSSFTQNISVFECVSDALITIKRRYHDSKTAVLVTGSLHLVGAALSILDPSFGKD